MLLSSEFVQRCSSSTESASTAENAKASPALKTTSSNDEKVTKLVQRMSARHLELIRELSAKNREKEEQLKKDEQRQRKRESSLRTRILARMGDDDEKLDKADYPSLPPDETASADERRLWKLKCNMDIERRQQEAIQRLQEFQRVKSLKLEREQLKRQWRAHRAKSYLLEQCQNTDLKEYLESKEKPRALPRLPPREATAMKSLSDRVTEMGMEAHTQNTRISMALDEHKGHIGALQKEASKLDRQHELERSRVSNCIVALEKEIATKTSSAETDTVNARLTTASNAIQRLETLATTKVSSETFERLQARIDTMEVSVIRKADSETLGKLSQAVTEQARQLESVSSQVRDQHGRVEVIEGRTETLKDQLLQKAEANNVYTSDGVDGMLRGFYNREEMDALLSRIWWRLGDVGKAPTTSSGPRPPTR